MTFREGECVAMIPLPAQGQVRVQVFRRDAGTYYRIDDLAAKWHRKRWTIIKYLKLMRHSAQPPTPEQVKRVGPNAARRYVEIREDYAALMRAVFLDRHPL